jgi:hypothetical protein
MPRTSVVGTTAPPGSGAPRCAPAGEREHRTDSTAGTVGITAAQSSPMVWVYDGQTCIGFVFSRGKLGFEAFDSDEKSIGLFPTQRAAAASVMRSPA